MFAISLLSLFGYHVYLISQNRTTLEAFRPPVFTHGGSNRKGFFLGKINNFREVLGMVSNKLLIVTTFGHKHF